MIKYLSLFSGIGAFEKTFVNQEIPFELVGFSEIDKYASKSYSEIHGVPESMNLGDITKIDETKLPEIDFITYGFPCQDISLAGKHKGLLNEDGTKTRSGLFFDALRIIEHTQPKVAIAENVKNLTSKKFSEQFQTVLDSLEDAGYNNYWQVLNAKDYGIPQNRERVFIVSIRKDVDNGRFQFPEPYELKLRLKDMLEDEVDEKFYLSTEQIEKIKNSIFAQERTRIQGDVCGSLLARNYKDPKCVSVEDYPKIDIAFNLYDMGVSGFNRDTGDILKIGGICKTIQTMQGGNRQPKILVTEDVEGDSINMEHSNGKATTGGCK